MADGKLIIETELGTKSFDAQYKELESKLKRDQKRLNELMKVKASGGDLDYDGLNSEIAKLQGNIEKTTNKMVDLKSKVKATGDESEETANKLNLNFNKMGRSIKRFGLALVGLRSIYSLVSRASSAYLSQDTELAENLKSIWVGLGSFLAPVLEMISDALSKALGYLNLFIYELTGIDFLARANAKALKSQANAQKELNRQTYDFDVIRTQQDTSSGGGTSASGGLFQIPELDENIVRKLQEMAKWLRENWNLIKKVGEVLLITFGAVKIAQVLKGIATLLGGAGTGLLGLQSVLTGLLTIGAVTLGVYLLYTAMTGRDLIKDLKDIKDGLKEVKEMTEKQTESEKHHTEVLGEFNKEMKQKIEDGKVDRNNLSTYTNLLRNNTRATSEQIKIIQSNTIVTKSMKEEEKALSEQLKETLSSYEYLYKQGLLNEKETKDYAYALSEQIGIMQYLGYNTDDLKRKYESLTGKQWNIQMTATDYTSSTLDKIKNKLQEIFGLSQQVNQNIGSSGSAYSSGGGRHYALGGIVTQPTRALIGEAGYPEAVVPMTQDYLSTLASEIARFGGGSGGGTVNVYLDGRLIQRQVSNVQNQKNFATNR